MRKILFVLSEFGYWGEELVAPLEVVERSEFEPVFVTPHGKRPRALPPSMDSEFFDPPLGCTVVSEEMAAKVRALDKSERLTKPRSLKDWFPERPYLSSANYIRNFEAYNETLKARTEELQDYVAVLLVGGSGPILDMVNNQRVHDVILGFYRLNKPIAAICYGVACLPMARDFNERRSILWGKHVTGHCIEYDYHDGTGFVGTDINIGPAPYTLEYVLRDTVGPDGMYHGNFGKRTSVIVDYPFITARSLQCSYEFAEQLVNVLTKNLKRYGW